MRWRRRRRIYVDDLPKTHDVRYGFLFLFGLVAVLLALYAIGFFVAGNKMPPGTAIGGIDVSGMTPAQARAAVQEELAPRLERSLTLVAAGTTYKVNPQRAGLAFDVDASVNTALGGASWDPRHMVRLLWGGEKIEPQLVVDQMKLNAALSKVAVDVDRKATDATVSFPAGKPQVELASKGQVLDDLRSQRRLVRAVQAGDRRVRLPLSSVPPAVTNAEANDFAANVATPAVGKPVTLRVTDTKLPVEPKVFAPALRTEVSGSELRLTVNAHQLYERSRSALESLPHSPVNATIGFGRSRPVITPSRSGISINQRDWAAAVLRAVSREGGERKATVSTQPEQPTFTTRDARDLGVRQRVSTAITRYPALPADELAGAARQLNGVLLKPGETLSFLDQVGVRPGEQAASLLAATAFDAAFRAGLTILERSAVDFYTGQYPVGRDARISPPDRDLLLRNDSPYGVYIRATVEPLRRGGGAVHVDVWSTPYWQLKIQTSPRHHVVKPQTERVRSRRCQPQRGRPGFDVDVSRVFLRHGRRVDSDVTHSSYMSLDRVICR